jgi:hypothetical protein
MNQPSGTGSIRGVITFAPTTGSRWNVSLTFFLFYLFVSME